MIIDGRLGVDRCFVCRNMAGYDHAETCQIGVMAENDSLRSQLSQQAREVEALKSLIGDFREGIDRDGFVAWNKEEAAAWYRAAGDALAGLDGVRGK